MEKPLHGVLKYDILSNLYYNLGYFRAKIGFLNGIEYKDLLRRINETVDEIKKLESPLYEAINGIEERR